MKCSLAKSTISKLQVMILSETTVIITDNEALAIELEISNNQNFTLATTYCPNGNPNLSLFQAINNLSDNVMFVRDFNSKLESFRCAIWSYAHKYSKTTKPYLLKQ